MTSKTLIYKVARFNNEVNGKSLQDLLVSALKKKSAALSRKKQGDSGTQFSLINYHGPHKGMRVGEYFDYTQGHKQPLAELDDNAESLTISALAPPDKKSEFLHSILYFGILKNSVILSQSQALKALQFEAYLNWLLLDCGLLNEGDFMTLSDLPPIELKKDVANTKGIEIHAPVNLEPVEETPAQKDITEVKTIGFRPSSIGWDTLKKLLPDEMSLPKQLNVNDVISNSDLEVTLKLSWSKTRKDDSTQLLDSIANNLRHVDTELDYIFHTRSGKITRDDLKLKRSISVAATPEGLIKKLEMWERMFEWLEILLTQERIEPDA